jgi:hypothetical protein
MIPILFIVLRNNLNSEHRKIERLLRRLAFLSDAPVETIPWKESMLMELPHKSRHCNPPIAAMRSFLG